MNINEENRNNTKRRTRRQSTKMSNNSILMSEQLNQKQIKEKNFQDKISYPPQISEIIAKIMIDKIISISFRTILSNENYNESDDYYFDYLNNQIDNILAINYLFYTEEPENLNNLDYPKYWKSDYRKANTWIEIKEPNTSKCDRYEGSFAKFFPIENDNKLNNDAKTNNINENNIINKSDINLKKSKNKKNFKNLKLNELESLEEIGSDSGDEENFHTKEKHSINKTFRVKDKTKTNDINSKQSFSLEKITTKKKNYEKVEFNSEDIPGINQEFNSDKYDPPEIENLRKEFEKMKEKNEHFTKIFFKKNSILNRSIMTNTKKFDSEKLTFDSDGQIIQFKPLNMNSLVNDFTQIKHKLEIIKPLKKFSFSLKNMKKVKNRKSSKNLSKNNIFIEKNPADNPILQRGFFIRINPEKKTQIIQSGNNFGLMLPNVGVVMKSEDKVKKGNRDFGQYFKKYSIEDFEKILKEYLPKENLELVKNKFKKRTSISSLDNKKNNLISLSINNSNNTNNFNNSIDLPNPLLNQDNIDNESNLSNFNNAIINKNNSNQINKKFFNNLKNSSLNYSSTIMNNNYNNSYNTKRNKKLYVFNSNMNEFIKIKNISHSSLKLELDSLNDLDIKNPIFTPENKRKKLENLFSKKYKDIFKMEKKEDDSSKEINDLNRMIVNDVKWGSFTIRKNISSQNVLFSKHKSQSQIFKELGNNFYNNFKLKLPRERKASVLI